LSFTRRSLMRMTGVVGAAVLLLAGASVVLGAELASGIPVGGSMPKYRATKCGGGDDGVDLGKSLCYT
jgi:hypothetical protein